MEAGPEHFGQEVRESGEEKARGLIAEELRRVGWKAADLERHRKGASEKIRIASLLRTQTTMTLGWIAQALHMGTKTHLAHLLYWQDKPRKRKPSAIARY